MDIRRADEKLAERVASQIERSGHVLGDVAWAAGLTVADLMSSLRAERPFTVADLLGIAGALGVPFISLIEGASE